MQRKLYLTLLFYLFFLRFIFSLAAACCSSIIVVRFGLRVHVDVCVYSLGFEVVVTLLVVSVVLPLGIVCRFLASVSALCNRMSAKLVFEI